MEMSEQLLAFVNANQNDPVCYLLMFENNTTVGNYLDILADGSISYLPANRTAENPYTANSRVVGKAGKLVRRFIKEEYAHYLQDVEVERFTNKVRAEFMFRHAKIDIVRGNEIRKWYHHRSYAPDMATLVNSCMRYDRCQYWFNLYEQNEDTCGLVIMTNQQKTELYARALLWTNQDGTLLLDRTYGSDVTMERLEQYGQEQNWLTKWKKNPTTTTSFNRKGQNEQLISRIPLKHALFDTYPYCDTMIYVSTEDKFLSNVEWEQTDRLLHGTDGNWQIVRR